MAYFPKVEGLMETRQFLEKVKSHFEAYGYGLYATVRKDTNEFIGFIGLLHVGFEAHFTPAVEIGWRLSHQSWGQGFATEGALKVLDYAFGTLDLPEVVSFTAKDNIRSRRVMEMELQLMIQSRWWDTESWPMPASRGCGSGTRSHSRWEERTDLNCTSRRA